jgi:hypothetical protein
VAETATKVIAPLWAADARGSTQIKTTEFKEADRRELNHANALRLPGTKAICVYQR